MSAAEVAAIAAILPRMKAGTDAADTEALDEANEEFHAIIHRATGNLFLMRSLASLRAYDHLSVGTARLAARRATCPRRWRSTAASSPR